MHEIVTLQLGHQANYVGTHFWNTQESYFTYGDDEGPSPINHDVHFRSGLGADGTETFMPRALIYDLKGGFGTLRKINALYEVGEAAGNPPKGSWDHETTTQRQEQIEAIQYQKDLEAGVFPPAALTTDAVRYWSDYNRVYYHPRSSVQINEYELNSGIQPFEGYGLGQELFKDLNREHDIIDRDFRLFAEECDQMQGIQLLTSTDDAWAGFAGEYLAELRDEYGKVGICTWGLERTDRVVRDKQVTRTIALAMALSNIASLSSVYIPLLNPPLPSALPGYLSVDRTSEWHTSALLSAAMETSTLPTRLHDGAGRLGRMDDLASFLNVNGGQKIAMLSMFVSGPEESPNANDGSYDDGRVPHPPRLEMIKKAGRINCSWGQQETKSWRTVKEDHVFAEANVARGFDDDDPEEPVQPERTGDRHEPIISRWGHPGKITLSAHPQTRTESGRLG
ncbi:tubulin domain-containing protein [Tricharina praecox]|uniref:tubulin domain-containing protein n=1 Tax=Tricharina praecox TaxID=43433 RepID=UPI00222035EC|nr:tubulin domain-containing protein [Tricharina praecox]KAI5848868.1 tubulin domain-containing protein [Tricharina praecox]